MTLTLAMRATMDAAGVEAGAREVRQSLDGIADQANATGRAMEKAGNRQAAAFRAASFQTRNLQFQLIDIAQGIPLAFQSPIFAMQNFAMQGAQIAQVYGPDEGGAARGLREAAGMAGRFAARLAPVGAVVGVVAAGFAGLRHEINQTSDTEVSFGDVFVATLQTARDGIFNLLRPAIEAIAPWAQSAWDAIVSAVHGTGNAIINGFAAAFRAVAEVWTSLPGVLGDAVYTAANTVIDGIEALVNGSLQAINGFVEQINRIPGVDIEKLGGVSLDGLDNPYAGSFSGAMERANAAIADQMQQDPMGGLFDAISSRAVKRAVARAEEEIDKGGKKVISAYERARAAIQQATQSQQLELSLVGVPDQIALQFRKEQELLNAATRDGRTLTADLYGEVERLARSYASAAVQTKAAQTAQEAYRETVRFAREITGSFINDLKQGLKAGEGFWKSFANAAVSSLDRIMDRMVSQSLDALFPVNQAPSGGGGIGGFVASLFGDASGSTDTWAGLRGMSVGGWTGPGGKYEPKGVVHAEEYVFSSEATRAIGVNNLESLHRAARNGFSNGGMPGSAPAGFGGVGPRGGGNMYVKIEDHAGVAIDTRREQTPDGDEMLAVMIDRVDGAIADGAFDSSFGRYSGGNVRGTRR